MPVLLLTFFPSLLLLLQALHAASIAAKQPVSIQPPPEQFFPLQGAPKPGKAIFKLKTCSLEFAGTNDGVEVRIPADGAGGTTSWNLLDWPGHDDFEQGSTEIYEISTRYLPVDTFALRVTGNDGLCISGISIDDVQITSGLPRWFEKECQEASYEGIPCSESAAFNAREDEQVPRSKVRIRTCDQAYAGSLAKIWAKFPDVPDSDWFLLDDPGERDFHEGLTREYWVPSDGRQQRRIALSVEGDDSLCVDAISIDGFAVTRGLPAWVEERCQDDDYEGIPCISTAALRKRGNADGEGGEGEGEAGGEGLEGDELAEAFPLWSTWLGDEIDAGMYTTTAPIPTTTMSTGPEFGRGIDRGGMSSSTEAEEPSESTKSSSQSSTKASSATTKATTSTTASTVYLPSTTGADQVETTAAPGTAAPGPATTAPVEEGSETTAPGDVAVTTAAGQPTGPSTTGGFVDTTLPLENFTTTPLVIGPNVTEPVVNWTTTVNPNVTLAAETTTTTTLAVGATTTTLNVTAAPNSTTLQEGVEREFLNTTAVPATGTTVPTTAVPLTTGEPAVPPTVPNTTGTGEENTTTTTYGTRAFTLDLGTWTTTTTTTTTTVSRTDGFGITVAPGVTLEPVQPQPTDEPGGVVIPATLEITTTAPGINLPLTTLPSLTLPSTTIMVLNLSVTAPPVLEPTTTGTPLVLDLNNLTDNETDGGGCENGGVGEDCGPQTTKYHYACEVKGFMAASQANHGQRTLCGMVPENNESVTGDHTDCGWSCSHVEGSTMSACRWTCFSSEWARTMKTAPSCGWTYVYNADTERPAIMDYLTLEDEICQWAPRDMMPNFGSTTCRWACAVTKESPPQQEWICEPVCGAEEYTDETRLWILACQYPLGPDGQMPPVAPEGGTWHYSCNTPRVGGECGWVCGQAQNNLQDCEWACTGEDADAPPDPSQQACAWTCTTQGSCGWICD